MTPQPLAGSGTTYSDTFLVDGTRTGFAELSGTLRNVSATDLGIAAAKGLFARGKVQARSVDMVIGSSLAHTDFDAYYLPRHIGLYAGIAQEVPAIFVHRLCGSGFDLLAQAADYIKLGKARSALCVGAESMSRNPVASFTSRSGFRMGQVDFKDFLWEALSDTAPGIGMGNTAENLAIKYDISRADADAFALRSFTLAAKAREAGYFEDEILKLTPSRFELEGYQTRSLRLPRGVEQFSEDEHARPVDAQALAKLRPVFGGVQTAGNSSGIVDGAAAAVVADGDMVDQLGADPLARIVAATAVGVAPEIMGIGPAPAIRKLLEITGLSLGDIDRFEINEAFSAQVIAVERELGLDPDKVNVNGGATALGHPLSATGLRCTITCGRELRRRGLRWGIASACCGGGQGSAVLIENPDA
ncbi:MAG: thiolase family protein [Rhodobacteraceae bacterium]|nr:thiolase family protein [Paracoccaceae bacterium]